MSQPERKWWSWRPSTGEFWQCLLSFFKAVIFMDRQQIVGRLTQTSNSAQHIQLLGAMRMQICVCHPWHNTGPPSWHWAIKQALWVTNFILFECIKIANNVEFFAGFWKEAIFITFSLGFPFALTSVSQRSVLNRSYEHTKSFSPPPSLIHQKLIYVNNLQYQNRSGTIGLRQAIHSTKCPLWRSAWWPSENCIDQFFSSPHSVCKYSQSPSVECVCVCVCVCMHMYVCALQVCGVV